MAKVKGCYAQPYAYGFTENGRIYIRLEGKIFDDLAFDSNIGVQLGQLCIPRRGDFQKMPV